MKKKVFKIRIVIVFFCVFIGVELSAQVKVTNGPELGDNNNIKMDHILGGDNNNFYCYRVRTKGRGTSYYIEKYSKNTLERVFCKEIIIPDELKTSIEDIEYANDHVYIFISQYNKINHKKTLYYQSVSYSGEVLNKKNEIIGFESDHFEFVDFFVTSNPTKKNFIVKVAHKANKEDKPKTDFILLESATMNKVWTKTVDQKLTSNSYLTYIVIGYINTDPETFLGLYMDDSNNIYYGYLIDKKKSKGIRNCIVKIGILKANENAPQTVELPFDDDYIINDIEFLKTENNQIVIGGFLKEIIEKTGRDLVKCGMFSFTVDLSSYSVSAKTVKIYDDKFLTALESNKRRSRYFNYKLDYIVPIGTDVYYIGEQYKEVYKVTTNSKGMQMREYWEYEYMDVIVGKLNAKGEFEWIKNIPLRVEMTLGFSHVYKQYITVATKNKIYILCNEAPDNIKLVSSPDFDPKDLESVKKIHGSNFVYSAINVSDGKIMHGLVFKNEKFCFAPIQVTDANYIPSSDCEIFAPGKNNEIYIYTEDRGNDRFSKITFE